MKLTVSKNNTRKNSRKIPTAVVCMLLLCAVLLLCIGSLIFGAKPLSLSALLQATPGNDTEAALIVWDLRAPRTLIGLIVGMALGIAGSLLQGLTRNPVADPVLLGIGAGAGLGITGATFLLHVSTITSTVWFGLLGSFVAAVTLVAIGQRIGTGMSGLTLILGGVAVQAGFMAISSALIIYDQQSLGTYRLWTVGSLAGRPTAIFLPLLLLLVLGLAIALYTAIKLNILALGDEIAVSMGENVRRIQLFGFLAVAILTTVAVAAAGPIAFVGLMCAHLAALAGQADSRWNVALAGLLGMCVVLFGDIVGRLIAQPAEVPAGIVLALIGAPYFIMQIKRSGVRT